MDQQTMNEEKIIIYCDGACANNQQRENLGGWGAILSLQGTQTKEIYGGEKNTTNNRMELIACIRALEAVKRRDLPVEVYSDSAYMVNCINQKWYRKWQLNGWKTSKKEPVENKDLWLRLLRLLDTLNVSFKKVKGHANIALNERADFLAKKWIKENS
jgi:ribonuclease HI